VVAEQLRTIAPALAFLCAGVPLAALLDELGFFAAVVGRLERPGGRLPVVWLWLLAGVTTAVLNLDTTVVLLTPLYVRIARRTGVDPFSLALIPLLLASLASSVLPISNLTTLIVVERIDASVGDVVAHLALPSLVASTVAWFLYRRRHPVELRWATDEPGGPPVAPGDGRPAVPDPRALWVGSSLVAALLVAFVLGPTVGIAPWMAVVAADLVLMLVLRTLPRRVPLLTAAGVAALAVVVGAVVPSSWASGLANVDAPLALVGLSLLAGAVADLTNNLPALLVALQGVDTPSWGLWAWLSGVNLAAVLTPIGALANLLWWRILRDEEVTVDVRGYLAAVVPVAGPAVVAGALVFGLQRVLFG